MRAWGVDLGGTEVKVGLVEDGRLLEEVSGPTEARKGPEAVMNRIAELCLSLSERGACLGVGTPGTVNPRTGQVLYCNNLNWRDVALTEGLTRRLGVKARAANDASLAALAEARVGATRGVACAAVVTLGTGIGCGITLDGQLWNSPAGAPEFGHTTLVSDGRLCSCGRRGCFEAYCSATGLNATARELLGDGDGALRPPYFGKKLLQARAAGHEGARRVAERWLDDLALGLGNLSNAYRPQVIAFGGGLTKGGDWFLAPLAEKMKAHVYGQGCCGLPRLMICRLGYQAGMIGAGLWALGV